MIISQLAGHFDSQVIVMNTFGRTMLFVAVATCAVLLAVAVHFTSLPSSIDGVSDVGQQFFPDFLDPLKATELNVVKYDTESKEAQSFAVRKNDEGKWVIPSHHDYPAEAAERLARTAASMIGIRKVAVTSRSKDDWDRYGVEDPQSGTVAAAGVKDETHGTRLTLKDGSGNALVDLIVGKAVEGREKHFYVRQPEKNNTFIATLDVELSTKFADWIEPDLLKVSQNDVRHVVVDRYTIDENEGAIVPGEQLEFNKEKTTSKWSLTGLDEATEQVKESAINDLVRNLDQLKIVGVRQKPEGLNADLSVSDDVAQNPLLRQVLQADMAQKGFFVARGPNNGYRLVSNEGELIAGTGTGVRYTLYFGEIARGSAKDIETGLNEKPAEAKPADVDAAKNGETAETKDDAEKKEDKADPTKPAEGDESGPRRYLLVRVDYDESLLGPKPEEPKAPEKPAILSETPGAPADAAQPATTPAPEAPKDAAPKSEEPQIDPKPEAPKDEGTPDAGATVEPKADAPAETTETPKADPGSCDEQPAAAVAPQEGTPAEPAPAQDPSAPAAATPAVPEVTPAQEATPAQPETTDPAAPAPSAQEGAQPAAEAASPVAQESTLQQPPVDPRAEAEKTYKQALGEFEAAKAAHKDAVKEWEDRAKDGKKRAKVLSDRFGAWYYVISAESFEKFQLSRAASVEPKGAAAQPDPGASPLNIPGLSPPIPGFPQQ